LALLTCLLKPNAALADGTVTGSFTVGISISSGPACSPASTTATITWTTNGPSTSLVFYDAVSQNSTDGYALSAEDTALVTAHSIA